MVSAQTGFGDPLIGNPLLLSVFAAVVIGGTALGGGRGGCAGPAIGAYTMMLIVNLLLVLNVSAYYSTVVTGVLLIFAALGGTIGRETLQWPQLVGRFVRRSGREASVARSVSIIERAQPIDPKQSWMIRHRDLIRFAAPSYVCFAVVVIVTIATFGRFDVNYVNSLLVLGTFLTILALGQGAVVLAGGLDLSIPWTMTLCGIVFTSVDFRRDLTRDFH